MVVKNQRALLKRLKKQVRLLTRKSEKARHQMRAALVKVRKIARAYKSRLVLKDKAIKAKIFAAQAVVCDKIAADVERQLMKKAAAKYRAVSSTVAKVEKKFAVKLAKAIKKKAKKSGKKKAARKATTLRRRMRRRSRRR